MLKFWLQVAGYASLAVLAMGVPAYQLSAGGDRVLWGGLALVALGLTLYLCWLYRARVDLPWWSILRGRRGGRRIAFTFDDGPNGVMTEAILDVLRQHGARATFFCLGRAAAAQPDILRRMAREGHVIGNHSQDHRKLPWLSREAIAHQIDAAQESIRQAGVPAPTWFRAPHGFKSPLLPGLLRKRGLRLCAWSFDLRDYDRPGAEVLVRRGRGRLRDGEIVLMHDGVGDRDQTVAALDEMLNECRRRGLRAVTIPEILSPP